jgi:alkylhydroperoxidase/carboxymuconolactone decarboxylase family protein YurZ
MAYLPDIYKSFNNDHPDVAKLLGDLSEMCNDAGPLDKRTQHLVKLGIAIGLESDGAIRSHVRRALQEGVADKEIEHVLLLALTTAGFPTMIAAYKLAHEVLEKQDIDQ